MNDWGTARAAPIPLPDCNSCSEDAEICIIGIEGAVGWQTRSVAVRGCTELEIYGPVLKLGSKELAVHRRAVRGVHNPGCIAVIDAGAGPLLTEPPVLVTKWAGKHDVNPAVR